MDACQGLCKAGQIAQALVIPAFLGMTDSVLDLERALRSGPKPTLPDDPLTIPLTMP